MGQTISLPLLLTLLIAMTVLVMRSFLSETAVQVTPDKYFGPNDIRGSAIVYKGKPYTLNFLQQTRFIDFLNRALAVGKIEPSASTSSHPFDRIVIYLFNGKEIELTPAGISDDNIYFSAPALQKNGYLQDVTQGRLLQLLKGTYGP